MAQKNFHGGCTECLTQAAMGIDFCKKCQYYKPDWSLPDFQITREKLEMHKIKELKREKKQKQNESEFQKRLKKKLEDSSERQHSHSQRRLERLQSLDIEKLKHNELRRVIPKVPKEDRTNVVNYQHRPVRQPKRVPYRDKITLRKIADDNLKMWEAAGNGLIKGYDWCVNELIKGYDLFLNWMKT